MSLVEAAKALDSLAGGHLPKQKLVLLGLASLDSLLLQGGGEQALHDAAAALELYVAAGGMSDRSSKGRSRYGKLAAAVRRAMTNG